MPFRGAQIRDSLKRVGNDLIQFRDDAADLAGFKAHILNRLQPLVEALPSRVYKTFSRIMSAAQSTSRVGGSYEVRALPYRQSMMTVLPSTLHRRGEIPGRGQIVVEPENMVRVVQGPAHFLGYPQRSLSTLHNRQLKCIFQIQPRNIRYEIHI